MDDIALTENDGFVVLGRKDKQVKIAGKLVDPQLVEAAILQIPNVQHCTITAKATEGTVKMHATIKLATDGEDERRAVRAQVRQTLAPHERPWHIEFTENM
jgi:acyl-coenzyme A synthetase/AMP-(fatty) acid ligase